MPDGEQKSEIDERKLIISNEDNILMKLTEILEHEHFITVDERNRAIGLIEKEGRM